MCFHMKYWQCGHLFELQQYDWIQKQGGLAREEKINDWGIPSAARDR